MLLSACSGSTGKIIIKDSTGIKKSLTEKLKKEYGLYVNKVTQISSTADFADFKLVLLGDAEPEMDIRIAAIGLQETGKFLFGKVESVQISKNMSGPDKNKPGSVMSENVNSEVGGSLARVRMFYGKEANYNEIIEKYISSANNDCVYLMKKQYAKIVAGKLNELVLESAGSNTININSGRKKESDTQKLNDSIDNLPPPPPDNNDAGNKSEDSQMVYQIVEVMPEFPGGTDELTKFIADNIKYTAAANEQGIQGTVYVKFVIFSDGSIGRITVLRSVSELLDAEAVRVIKKLPKFEPGKQNGKPVNVSYILPVRFGVE